MKTKPKLSEYFHFTLKDRVAALFIAFIMITALLLPSFLEHRRNTYIIAEADTAWISALKQLEKKSSDRERSHSTAKNFGKDNEFGTGDRAAHDKSNNSYSGELFNFDPNTLDVDGWRRLGLREKTINTILNYRNKGGRFRKPEDLKKIYGFPPTLYQRVQAYVQIAPQSSAIAQEVESVEKTARKPDYITIGVDINTADSIIFEKLPGIGSKLAARLIRFREKLGGFHSIEQVKETFGLPDSSFQKIKPYLRISGGEIKKININEAEVNELKEHPYIRYNIANAIVQYRQQHGAFASLEDLKKIAAIDMATYEKMIPYLVAGE